MNRPEDCLAGGGEMGAMMREVDWAASPLGPVARWPQSLRTAVSMLLESRFAMVVAWGPEFRFFYNDRYLPVLGAKHPHSLCTPAAEIFPEVWPIVGPEFERVRQGITFAVDDWLLPLERSGYRENCWFSVSYSPIRDETGGVGGLLAVVVETTGRVEGERRLATLRELAALAADAKTPAQACSNATIALARNPTDVPFALIYTLDGHTELAASTGLAPDHAAAAADAWPIAEVVRTGKPLVVSELVGPLPGGDAPEPTHSAIVLPLARPNAPVYGVLVAGISPRRAIDDRYRAFFELAADHIATAIANARALEEQRQRAEQLAELDRAKTVFFSNVSHELRTPLTLILGPLADLLGGQLGPEVHGQLELVQRNAQRLQKLVNAMLDFTRIEAGRARATYVPVDLAAYTSELAGMFRSAIERAGLALVVDCPPLPEPVFVDPEMWEKIVLNLMSNAFKFTFAGAIEVALGAAGEFVELRVRDSGCGIPPAELARVFERFHRGTPPRARTQEGTGIGLALSLELARLHGGDITIASEVGRGTELVVRIRGGSAHLPVEQLAVQQPVATHHAYVTEALRWLPDPEPDAPIGPHGAMTILVADDNADMRDYLRRMLEPFWRVITVGDGATALAHILSEPPDLLVTDVMMPGLDGFALMRMLREDPATRSLPIVMLSARAGDEARAEGLAAGADDYLVKPFTARELLARVSSRLATRVTQVRRETEVSTLRKTVDYNERFTAILGHDLRNPLNAIMTTAQLLRRRGKSSDITAPAARIELAAERMARMISQLLDLARLRVTGGLQLATKPTDLGQVCRQVLDELRSAHPEARIELATSGDLQGRWDGDRLAQVISNLAGNAIEHGTPEGPVHVGLAGNGTAITMHVKNPGAIAAEVLPTLFDPFRGATHRHEKTRGLGLGLYISQQVVTAHRGTIDVRSNPVEGTCFEIQLPRGYG